MTLPQRQRKEKTLAAIRRSLSELGGAGFQDLYTHLGREFLSSVYSASTQEQMRLRIYNFLCGMINVGEVSKDEGVFSLTDKGKKVLRKEETEQ